ncbi:MULTISPECIES: cupin domain-containing protein [Sphingomonas]|uniref:Mannose-6-phosphate isomerase-like protein (Cupin superfamily) n=1 Tax=Sphingomonas trueperi TaxID=53317 RepID=A0A7X6BEM7_9SPHN|nr:MULTISPECIES: cupin domain-containing protein [unclassified Sphingomonas]NJB99091.1 mannose-6-phosphate isomerase-like protein (cupin superfamily) [Sphingomonas trueperi]
MAEQDDELRAMAAHRGLKLVKSRRRKPGGDFGRYGLKDAGGAEIFGVGADGLTADAEAIRGFLRGGMRSDWSISVETTPGPKRAPKPKPSPKSKPAPPPKPRFKPEVANLLRDLPEAKDDEAFTDLLKRPGVRIERIVSRGQATPDEAPMVQDWDEWVVLLEGAAGIRIEDSAEVRLAPGDHLLIQAGQKHWVTWTARDRPSVWLAVHLDG